MAVTTEEILARGQGPVQTTWVDQAAPVTPTQPLANPAGGNEPTGVEGVSYETATAKGTPNTPKNTTGVVQGGVANPQTTTDVEQVTPVDKQQTSPEERKLSYVELFQQMSPYKPPTPEELEKERKKQKREVIFAAIGEGISAMSNLYFTTQYAPNAFDPSQGMAATTKARFDHLKKEREQNQREYMEGFMRAMKWDADDARDERNWNHTIEREKVTDRYKEAADARAQAKADRDAAMAELRMQRIQGQIDDAELARAIKQVEKDYADAYWRSRIDKNNYRRPIGSGGGGKKTSVWKAYNPTTGEEVTIHATDKANAWSQCPQGYQIRQEPTESTSTREQKNRRGQTTKSTTTTTTKNPSGKTGGVSSPKGGKKPNPMGADNNGDSSGNKQKKKNPMS